MVCVTTLPCEILITTFRMFLHVYYHKNIENTKTFTFDQIDVSK